MNGLSKVVYPVWVNFILILLRCWLVIYDLLAYLPFKFLASPKRKLERSNRLKVIFRISSVTLCILRSHFSFQAKPLIENDPSSAYRNVECPNGELVVEEFPECDTLDKLFERAFFTHSECDCKFTVHFFITNCCVKLCEFLLGIGTRQIISVDEEKQPNGRIFEKVCIGSRL